LPPRGAGARQRRVTSRPSPPRLAGESSMTAIRRELFRRHPANPILEAADWPYPVNAVFNPGAAVVDGETVVLARVEALTGVSHLTVARSANGVDGWSVATEPLLEPAEGV